MIHLRADCEAKEEAAVRITVLRPTRWGAGTVKALHERNVRVRAPTNSLASNDMLRAFRLCQDRGGSRTAWSYTWTMSTDAFDVVLSGGRQPRSHMKAMAFDREAVFVGSFNLDPRSAVINTEGNFYIESPELAKLLRLLLLASVPPTATASSTERRDRLGDGEGRQKGAPPGRAEKPAFDGDSSLTVEAAAHRTPEL